jgi:hypothetical protein
MYSHTIIKVLKNGVEMGDEKNKAANAEFRDVLISNLTLLKPVDIG